MPAPESSETPRQPDGNRDPALDGLRGVAILLVFLFHYGGGLRSPHAAVRAFGLLTQAGWIGVDLFFVLSGFLITGLLWDDLGRPHALQNFYARRALRILPIYYGALMLAAITALATGASAIQLRPLLVYAGFLQNLPPLVREALRYPPPLPLHHLWSLAVEEQFYLLWPFLLVAARTRRRALHLCLWTFALTCLFRAILFAPGETAVNPALWSAFLFTRTGGLALGGALALATGARHQKWLQRWAAPLLWIAILAFATAGILGHDFALSRWPSFVFALPAVEVGAVALLALTRMPGRLRQALDLGFLGWLGRISYGFYVFHILLEPVFDDLGKLQVPTGTGSAYQTVRLLVAFPITAVAAWLSFTCIEQPFLRLKRLFPR